MIRPATLPDLLAVFDLGSDGTLSSAPVASGRQGVIWRLETDRGSWAVKEVAQDASDDDVTAGAHFQEAAIRAGVPAPAIVRTTSGRVVARLDGVRVRVYGWVDLLDPDPALDPAALGRLVATLHQVDYAGGGDVDPWYTDPVGEPRWRELVTALRAAGAPFVDELETLVPELVALERWLGGSRGELRTCHRDLWTDNLRGTPSGGICVFDFENCGLAEPGQELATALFEFCSWDSDRAALMKEAYRDAGGAGRVEDVTDFAMAIAQQGHIVEVGCRRWLAAAGEEDRADNEGWVREFIDRPMTRAVVETLLSAQSGRSTYR